MQGAGTAVLDFAVRRLRSVVPACWISSRGNAVPLCPGARRLWRQLHCRSSHATNPAEGHCRPLNGAVRHYGISAYGARGGGTSVSCAIFYNQLRERRGSSQRPSFMMRSPGWKFFVCPRSRLVRRWLTSESFSEASEFWPFATQCVCWWSTGCIRILLWCLAWM